MARMTLGAVLGLSLFGWGAQVCVAQSAAPPPPPAVVQSGAASARLNDGQGAGRAALDACRGDMKALCGGVARGGGRKFACLKENQSKLSAACQGAIQTVLEQHGMGGGKRGHAPRGGKAMAACRADIASVCAGVEKGNGAVGLCLRENAAKLTLPCQGVLAERRALQLGMRQACKGDIAALCGEAETGKARRQCLLEKQAQVSTGCQQALAALPGKQGKGRE
ncbi:MAG: hypothetical protein ABL901_20550 [Hyphomicrobiaceae bacterium]